MLQHYQIVKKLEELESRLDAFEARYPLRNEYPDAKSPIEVWDGGQAAPTYAAPRVEKSRDELIEEGYKVEAEGVKPKRRGRPRKAVVEGEVR